MDNYQRYLEIRITNASQDLELYDIATDLSPLEIAMKAAARARYESYSDALAHFKILVLHDVGPHHDSC